jgi:hypothetical protein
MRLGNSPWKVNSKSVEECTLLIIWLNEKPVVSALDIKDQIGQTGKGLQRILMGRSIGDIIRGAETSP